MSHRKHGRGKRSAIRYHYDHEDLVRRQWRWAQIADDCGCDYCGRPLKLETSTVDHIVPLGEGGADHPSNWALSCWGCNKRKGPNTPEEAGMPLRIRRVQWRDFVLTIGPPSESGWSSYLPMLDAALEGTTGPVLELGAGDGSTRRLHRACAGRGLVTMESDVAWLSKFAELETEGEGGHALYAVPAKDGVPQWEDAPLESWYPDQRRWGVVLVDHAPGERRIHDIRRLAACADILVVHDTEPGQARHGYGYDAIWELFEHRLDDTRLTTWTTLLSNFVDVSKWGFTTAQ